MLLSGTRTLEQVLWMGGGGVAQAVDLRLSLAEAPQPDFLCQHTGSSFGENPNVAPFAAAVLVELKYLAFLASLCESGPSQRL